MTTIGTAVLQIIPSLRGVTEAIDSQIDGKAVEIQVKPKVDQRATEAAAKQTRETVEKQTTEVKVQPKVDKRAAEQAGKDLGDEITKTVEKSSPGKDLAKVLVDGIADGVKDELRGGTLVDEFVDGLADGVKQGIDQGGVSKTILSTISDGLKSGNVGGTIKDAVLPGITGLRSTISDQLRSGALQWSTGIAEALRSGDIQGATTSIGDTVLNTTDLIANIGETFGLQLGGVREFAEKSAGSLTGVGGNIQSVIDTTTNLKSTFNDVGNILETVLPGKADKGAAGVQAALNRVVAPVWLTALLGNEIANKLDDILPGEDHPDRDAGWAPSRGLTAPKRIWEMITGQRDPNTGEVIQKVPADLNLPPGYGNGPHGGRQSTTPKPTITGGPTPSIGGIPVPNAVIGPDGKPIIVPGRSSGGFTGNFPIDQIAGVVHGKEFVLKAISQERIENDHPGLLDHMNKTGKLPGYDGGGLVGPDVSVAKTLAGIPYSQGNRTDCSGMVSRVILQSLGKSGGLMTTKTADKWLSALGFRSGTGGPGAITVGWYDRGPNPNDGHMAMTLSDGTHAEAGGRNRVFTLGAGARGGDDSSFDRHMFLNLLVGRGSASGDGQITGEGPATGGIPAPTGVGIKDAVLASVNSAESSSGGVSVPSSISGLAGLGGDAISAGHTSSEGHRDPLAPKYFPHAVTAAVSGQVSSALGVLGVPDSPGWLQGISDFVGGISVTEKGTGKKIFGGSSAAGAIGGVGSLFGNAAPGDPYGGAAPAAAAVPAGPAQLPDAVHDAQAGAKPGPTVNYNIRTALTEDAFIEARKQEQIRLASKIDRF